MAWLQETMQQGRPASTAGAHGRVIVDEAVWTRAGQHLASGDGTMLSLWGDTDTVHLAVLEEGRIGVLTLACPTGGFLPLAACIRPPCGSSAPSAISTGCSPRPRPMRGAGSTTAAGACASRSAGGRPSPQPATRTRSILSKAHRCTRSRSGRCTPASSSPAISASPPTARRWCAWRSGWVTCTRASTVSWRAQPSSRRPKLAGRVSGDSTVAYAIAFAHAVEAALGLEPPPRAVWLRALMAELERIANHFGDIGAICNDASFSLMHAHCGILREHVLRAADICFGHRLMMDRVVPGGVAADLRHGRRGHAAHARRTDPAPLSGAGRALRQHCLAAAAHGHNGGPEQRAGAAVRGRWLRRPRLRPPVRRAQGAGLCALSTSLRFDVPVRQEGDVDARVWVRIEEVNQSVSLIEQMLEALPEGAMQSGEPRPAAPAWRAKGWRWSKASAATSWSGCGSAPMAGSRAAILRDPSWFQWPLLEAAIEGNIVADFPLCNKSFNCSYSGHDL